jgi:hypothetical protein
MIQGSGGSKKEQRKAQSTEESGTAFNKEFMDQALEYFKPGAKATVKGEFDPARYLRENPDVAADPRFSQDPVSRHLKSNPRRYRRVI